MGLARVAGAGVVPDLVGVLAQALDEVDRVGDPGQAQLGEHRAVGQPGAEAQDVGGGAPRRGQLLGDRGGGRDHVRGGAAPVRRGAGGRDGEDPGDGGAYGAQRHEGPARAETAETESWGHATR